MLRSLNRVIIPPNKSIFRRNVTASIRCFNTMHSNTFYSLQRLKPTKSFLSSVILRNIGNTIYDIKEINENSTNREKFEFYFKTGFDRFCKVCNLILYNDREDMKMQFPMQKKHFHIVKIMKINAILITL